jgi:hypothetical protein
LGLQSAADHTFPQPRHSLAERKDGDSLAGLGLYQNRKEVQQDHGLSRSLDQRQSLTTLSLPLGKLQRSIIDPTAARHFQLRAGYAQK